MRSRGFDTRGDRNMLLPEDLASEHPNPDASTNGCRENMATDVDCRDRDVESSRKSSTAWSIAGHGGEREKFRTLERRSSVENFGQFGFLVPALALVPKADGADALTKQFGDLQGEHRELKLAAAHIEDALKGRGNYGKARSYFKPKLAQRCFNILDNPWFRRVIYCNILLHSFLIVFEPPTVPPEKVSPLVLALGLFCILLYVFDLVVHIIFLTWPVFWSREAEAGIWNGVQFVLVSLFLVDYILLVASGLSGEYIPQIFRCFRLLVVLYKVKNIRHIFNVLITIGFKLSKVFFIIFVFILMCGCIGIHIFMDIYECNGDVEVSNSTTVHNGKTVPCAVTEKEKVYKGAFNNILEGMLRLFVLLSTENYPEVMLPALRTNAGYFTFFGLFVFVGVFFLTAILLAIVVDSYWVYSKKHVKKERSRERAELAKAWNLLDPLGHGALDVNDGKFTELFRILKPKYSDEENGMLIEMLDTNEDGEVDSFEWTTMLSQVLSLEFEKEDILLEDPTHLSKCAYRIKETARFVTESVTFPRLILLLIIVHCILFTFKWKGQSMEVLLSVQVLRSTIVLIFLFEVAMRVLVYGKMILEPFELMDLILVIVAFLSNFLWYINYPDFFVFRDYATAISGLAVFFRLPFNNTQLKRAIEIFVRIAPVMADLMCVLGIILYFMGTVGMELFHKAVTTEGHMYLPSCGLGFDNFWCSCLILFQMVTTSNWHEIMNSVMDATGIPWTSLYFVVAYIVVNMVVMNLFVAIAIEAFNKLAASEDEQQPTLERKATELRPFTAEPDSVKNQAVEMLNSFANSLFGSSRADQVEERRQSLAVSGSKRRPSMRRGSVVKTMGPITNGEDPERAEDEVQDDFEKSDGKGDKREWLLKKRMKEKKRAKRKLSMAEQKVRVVTAFRGSRENELELTVGDEVTVIKKKDDWWQGRCQKRTGWFPASHVILRTVKAIPEYGRHGSSRDDVEGGGRERLGGVYDDPRCDQVSPLVKENSPVSPKENSFFRESTWANPPPGTPPVRGRVKLKKTGDWRREILGDMTVMNAEEMRELNNIMRAELRTPTGLRSKKLSVISRPSEDDSMRDSVFMEDQEFVDIGQVVRPGSSRSIDTRPYSARFLDPGSPRFARNAVGPSGRLRTESGSSTDSQRSRAMPPIPSVEFFGARTPTAPNNNGPTAKKNKSADRLVVGEESPKKPPPKEKNKSGEMPQWMLKFVQDKNLVVGEDVKLDEHSGRRRSSTATVTSTNMGCSGSPRSRDFETGTKARKKAGSSSKSSTMGTKEAKNKSTGNSPGEVREKAAKKSASPNLRKKSTTPHTVAQQPL